LYEYIPEIYRTTDESAGGLLETFAESLRSSFDELRRSIQSLETVRDPLTVRTRFDEIQFVTLGERIRPSGDLEQRGSDARVDAISRFIAPKARFTTSDIGKELTILNSVFPENNRTVVIASIVNPTTVLTEPNLSTDAGLLTWELRPVVEEIEGVITLRAWGDVAAIKPSWILNDGRADFEVLARRSFPSLDKDPNYLTDREGRDGTIDGFSHFISASIALTQADAGRVISISTSVEPGNNTRWEIIEVVDATEAILQDVDGNSPIPTGVAFFWALLPFAELDIFGAIEPSGTIQASGVSGLLLSATDFQLTSGEFTADDVGKVLTIRGSATPSHNGTFEIIAFVDSTTVTLDASLAVDAGPLTWEMRVPTTYDDRTKVQLRAPALISWLARDFGIAVDNQENENRQRSWVANVSRWISRKGTAKAYEIIGSISGYNVEVSALYRISIDISSLLTNFLEVGDPGEGRTGVDGTLSEVAGLVRFSSPTAQFGASDVGSHIRVTGAAVLGNNTLYTIETFINVTTVEMRMADTVTLPEANNGSLVWAVVKLYVETPPTLPNFDEFDSDLMEVIIDGLPVQSTNYFGVDKYCFEDDFFADVEVLVTAVSPLAPGVFLVTVDDGPPQGPSAVNGTAAVILAVRNWLFIDSANVSFFVETVPALVAGTVYTFEVKAAVAPTTGSAILRYVCPVNTSCDFCASSKVLARVTADTISEETGVAVENAFNRVLARLEETTPIHVQLVPLRVQGLGAAFNLGATVETP